MKKLFLVFVAFVLLVGCGKVEAFSLKTEAKLTVGLEDLNVGTYLSVKNGEIYVGGSIPVVSWDKTISLDIGLASDLQKRPIPLGSLSVDVQALASKFGLEYNLLEPMKIGGWYGRTLEKNKFDNEDYGVYATLTYKI